MSLLLDAWVVVRDLSWSAETVTLMTGTTSAVGSGYAAHWWQKRRARVLPALPSHAEALSGPPDDATRFFASVHEIAMCVTEAWNAVRAREAGGTVESVIKRDVLARHRDALVEAGRGLRGLLADYASLVDACPVDDFYRIWDYRAQHHYRTETYTVRTTDSKGKSRTETRTRQVYDHSEHFYTFHRDGAQRVEALLRSWCATFGKARLPSLGLHDREVRIDRLEPAERSFLERIVRHTVLEDPEAVLDDEDLAHWANQWLVGTRIDAKLQAFREAGVSVGQHLDETYRGMYASEPQYYFKTRSRSHGGPPGYQLYRRTWNWLESVRHRWSEVSRMLYTCVSNADKLVSYASDASEIESDREYAELAIQMYETAFPKSEIELDQLSSTGRTVALGLLGGVVASGATYLLHPMGVLAW